MLAEGEPDPATPAARLAFSRRLLIESIRRYEDALALCLDVDANYPRRPDPWAAESDAEKDERFLWRRLSIEADSAFESAEECLASRIFALYDRLAPEGARLGQEDNDEPFRERAVRFEGTTYILNYHPDLFEGGTNIVAVVRDGRTFDLGAPDADGRCIFR
jgi:hypothetical protein